MMKRTYTVDVTRTRIVTVGIEIEAASFEEAESLALEGAKAGRYEIDFNEYEGSNEDEYELGESWCTETEDEDCSLPYHQWEGAIIDLIEQLCDCTRSDAQGIVEAQDFYLTQSWTKGLTAEQTARIIEEKSKA